MIRFLLPICLLSGAAFAQSAGDEARQARYESCLKKAQDDPDNAYEDALAWRFHFMIGAMIHMLAFGSPLGMEASSRSSADGLARLLAFAVAGITNGIPSATQEKRA